MVRVCHSVPRIRLDSTDPSSAWNYKPGGPSRILYCDRQRRQSICVSGRGVERTWENPLEALEWMSRERHSGDRSARWVGYLSYDLGRLFEEIPARIPERESDWPLFIFTFHGDDEDRLPAVFPLGQEAAAFSGQPLRSNFTRGRYERDVVRALEYIAAGDIFQVNLSQRFTAGLQEEPAAIYERLRAQSPALYGACLEYGSKALLCNSPELFLRVAPDPASGQRRVITRPNKGTRPRRPGMEEELRASVKDQAELNMIVDLERNDLGRVCRIGSVKVTESRAIEAHPTVYHGVATVEGMLREDVTFVDLLRATFPGGSITGAPKIRAMQIIEELEPDRRGPYCGAIGYLSADGRVEFNMAIRTMIVEGGRVHIPVGGGIVADSTPGGEYEETLVKAEAVFGALGICAATLQ